ncbi:MAG: hypothetical protein AAF575_00055 [Bacteroidota bacterium]
MVTIKLTKDQIDTYQSFASVIKELSDYGNEISVDQQHRIFERADQLENFFKQYNPNTRVLRKHL